MLNTNLLRSYIKKYIISEATPLVAFDSGDINPKLQSSLSLKSENNKVDLSDEETLVELIRNAGPGSFISFVDKYDEDVPRLEVNPHAAFNTPHGQYGYPLTMKSLESIIRERAVADADFAFERPYFHIFKIASNSNTINIERSGKSNYKGNLQKDLKTMVQTAIMFELSKNIEPYDLYNKINSKSQAEIDKLLNSIDNINLNYQINTQFRPLIKDLSDNGFFKEENSNTVNRESLNKLTAKLLKALQRLCYSDQNKFYKTYKDKMDKFHILYYVSWALTNSLDQPTLKKSTGTIFTMLLNSIGIDFISDKGSATIHMSEPQQGLHISTKEKGTVVHIGTYRNIFEEWKEVFFSDQYLLNLKEKYPDLNISGLFFDENKKQQKKQPKASEFKEFFLLEMAKLKQIEEKYKNSDNEFNFSVTYKDKINDNNIEGLEIDIGLKTGYYFPESKNPAQFVLLNLMEIVKETPGIVNTIKSFLDKVKKQKKVTGYSQSFVTTEEAGVNEEELFQALMDVHKQKKIVWSFITNPFGPDESKIIPELQDFVYAYTYKNIFKGPDNVYTQAIELLDSMYKLNKLLD